MLCASDRKSAGVMGLEVGIPQVCQQAGVPLEAVPLSQQYWDRVVTHSIAEIRAGHTPNPDVMCNARCAAALLCPEQTVLDSQPGNVGALPIASVTLHPAQWKTLQLQQAKLRGCGWMLASD